MAVKVPALKMSYARAALVVHSSTGAEHMPRVPNRDPVYAGHRKPANDGAGVMSCDR